MVSSCAQHQNARIGHSVTRGGEGVGRDRDRTLHVLMWIPLCGEACAAGDRHKTEHELYTTAGLKARGKPDYPQVIPIRLLQQMEENTTLRDRIALLMDHREESMLEKSSRELTETYLVDPLIKLYGKKKWTSEDIQRCTGLF